MGGRKEERGREEEGEDVDRDFGSMQKKRREMRCSALRGDTPALNCPLVTQPSDRGAKEAGRRKERRSRSAAQRPSRSLNS